MDERSEAVVELRRAIKALQHDIGTLVSETDAEFRNLRRMIVEIKPTKSSAAHCSQCCELANVYADNFTILAAPLKREVEHLRDLAHRVPSARSLPQGKAENIVRAIRAILDANGVPSTEESP